MASFATDAADGGAAEPRIALGGSLVRFGVRIPSTAMRETIHGQEDLGADLRDQRRKIRATWPPNSPGIPRFRRRPPPLRRRAVRWTTAVDNRPPVGWVKGHIHKFQ